MPKLNYTNRKSDGPKLGAIVHKDLCKRITSTKHQDHSPLELNLEGKALTDQGLYEVASGLVAILRASGSTEKLHVLHLARNKLTAQSLAHLAPVIEAAAGDLQDLDLTDNDIEIASEESHRHWEYFLRSFGDCHCLRRVSLDRNNLGSAKAWESFLGIYLEQFRSSEDLWSAQNTCDDDVDDARQDEETSLVDSTSDLSLDNKNGHFTSKARGIPAILIFGLTDTHLTDACSLFLSYVFERHHFLQNEVNGRLWISGAVETTFGASGIMWQPNNRLGAVGVKMLKDAEAVPWHPFDHQENDQQPVLQSERHASEVTPDIGRTTHAMHGRNGSQASHDLTPACKLPSHVKDSASGELDSLRKKVQRAIIEERGPLSVQLWSSALRLLVLVRQYMIAPYPLITDTRWKAQAWDMPEGQPAFSMPGGTQALSLATPHATSNRPCTTWSSKLASEAATPDRTSPVVTNLGSRAATAPRVFHPPTERRRVSTPPSGHSGSMSQHSPHSTSTHYGNSPAHLPYLADLRPIHETEMIGKLPAAVLETALCSLADPAGVLSSAQRRRVVAWARDRRTLVTEQEALGKPRSVQIWRVLEGMGCIAYDD